MNAECPGIQPETARRLVTLSERLSQYRAELAEGHVNAELWSGVVECGAEATSLREATASTLDAEPDCERARHTLGYVSSIENDIWSFANAIAGLCLKQSNAGRETDR